MACTALALGLAGGKEVVSEGRAAAQWEGPSQQRTFFHSAEIQQRTFFPWRLFPGPGFLKELVPAYVLGVTRALLQPWCLLIGECILMPFLWQPVNFKGKVYFNALACLQD